MERHSTLGSFQLSSTYCKRIDCSHGAAHLVYKKLAHAEDIDDHAASKNSNSLSLTDVQCVHRSFSQPIDPCLDCNPSELCMQAPACGFKASSVGLLAWIIMQLRQNGLTSNEHSQGE